MISKLTEDHVRLYESTGYIDIPSLLDEHEVAELRQRTVDIINGRIPEFPDANVELEPHADGLRNQQTVRKLNRCAESDPVFMRYALNDKILDIVEALLGPDVKLFGSQAFMKPPGGVEKPYHQDSPYFHIKPMALTTCWIALDEVTRENGCLWVVPGSHKLGPLAHSETWAVGERKDMRIPESAFDRSQETPITLGPGDCSFHHSLLLHMSHPNRTDQSRRSIAFHFMTARSRWTDLDHPQPEYRLLRGQAYPGCV